MTRGCGWLYRQYFSNSIFAADMSNLIMSFYLKNLATKINIISHIMNEDGILGGQTAMFVQVANQTDTG
jgi:hypothetical protein